MIRELIDICILEIDERRSRLDQYRRCCTYGSGESFESCARGTGQLQQSRSKEPHAPFDQIRFDGNSSSRPP